MSGSFKPTIHLGIPMVALQTSDFTQGFLSQTKRQEITRVVSAPSVRVAEVGPTKINEVRKHRPSQSLKPTFSHLKMDGLGSATFILGP